MPSFTPVQLRQLQVILGDKLLSVTEAYKTGAITSDEFIRESHEIEALLGPVIAAQT
jgi:hypothetical protein